MIVSVPRDRDELLRGMWERQALVAAGSPDAWQDAVDVRASAGRRLSRRERCDADGDDVEHREPGDVRESAAAVLDQ